MLGPSGLCLVHLVHAGPFGLCLVNLVHVRSIEFMFGRVHVWSNWLMFGQVHVWSIELLSSDSLSCESSESSWLKSHKSWIAFTVK